jgi:hypothetical protein
MEVKNHIIIAHCHPERSEESHDARYVHLLGVPLRVGLSTTIFCSCLAKGFPFQSLTRAFVKPSNFVV